MAIADGTWKRNGPFKGRNIIITCWTWKKIKGNPCQGHGTWEVRNEFFLRCGWKNVIKGGSDRPVFKLDWPPSLQPVHMSLTLHPQPTHFHSEIAGSMFLHNTGCKYQTVCCHNPEDCNMNSHCHKKKPCNLILTFYEHIISGGGCTSIIKNHGFFKFYYIFLCVCVWWWGVWKLLCCCIYLCTCPL
jgi:hypothetical protein